jgi:hypothetical protein
MIHAILRGVNGGLPLAALRKIINNSCLVFLLKGKKNPLFYQRREGFSRVPGWELLLIFTGGQMDQ